MKFSLIYALFKLSITGDESMTSSARSGSLPEEKKSTLVKFLKVMEFTGFLPVTWLPANPEVAEEQRVFVRVTFAKTLIVCFVDLLVVLGNLLMHLKVLEVHAQLSCNGPCWWYSGHCLCLLLQQSEFESR